MDYEVKNALTSLGTRARNWALRHSKRPMVKNTIWSLSGYSLQLAIQGVYFVLIARSLGPSQYGGFISAVALASILAPLIGLGTGNLLVKNVARDPSLFPVYWGNALLMTTSMGLFFSAAVMMLFGFVLPRGIPIVMVGCICVSDLIFARLLDVAFWATQAFGNFATKAQLTVLLSLLRFFGIVGLLLIAQQATALSWSVVYLCSSTAVSTIGIAWVLWNYGWPTVRTRLLLDETVEGFYFSVSLASQSIYNDIDKAMVARLAGLVPAGIYAAAYRLIDTSFLPVRSILNSAYPEFFKRGQGGLSATKKYGCRLLLFSLPYAVGISALLYLAAPIVPYFLGHSFAKAANALRWLSPLPLIKTLHYFAADSLTGAGYQKQRTIIQGIVAAFNFLVNLWLIPAFGWLGASWSSLASDGMLAVLLWLLVWQITKSVSVTSADVTELVTN